MMPCEVNTKPIRKEVKIPRRAVPVKFKANGSPRITCSTMIKVPIRSERQVIAPPIQPKKYRGVSERDTKLFIASLTS